MKIEACAKVNFTLEVLGERADGFHALRSFVAPVSLSDTLEIEPRRDGAVFSDTGFPDDLCVKAAKALRDAAIAAGVAGAERFGAAIRVEKRIPAGGGLGGGSADAAAVLLALDRLWNLGFGRERLAATGALAGSDVPALVLAQGGSPVAMEGRGEKVRELAPAKHTFDIVLANPGVHSSTPAVFAKSTPRVTNDPAILYNIICAFESGDIDAVAAATVNDLEESALSLYPAIAGAEEALAAAGAKGVRMSGSGSTVFGLAESEESARRIAGAVRAKGFSAWSAKTCCPVV